MHRSFLSLGRIVYAPWYESKGFINVACFRIEVSLSAYSYNVSISHNRKTAKLCSGCIDYTPRDREIVRRACSSTILDFIEYVFPAWSLCCHHSYRLVERHGYFEIDVIKYDTCNYMVNFFSLQFYFVAL